MGKKIIGVILIGLVFALVIPVGSCDAAFQCNLSAIGMIRIDSTNSAIKGFVLIGDNNGQDLRFTFINIQFDDRRAPEELTGKLPFLLHNINYNPAA